MTTRALVRTSRIDPAACAGGPKAGLAQLAERSRIARDQARWSESAALATLGLAEAVGRGEVGEIPDFLNLLGSVAFQSGEMERSEGWFAAALRTAERLDDPSRRAAALVNLGAVANVRGRFQRALACYRRGRHWYHRAANPVGEARALHNMGLVNADMKRWRRAALCYRLALRRACEGEDELLVGLIALNASEVELALGQLEIARQSCDEAADRLTAMEAWAGVADVDLRYGEIFRRMGKPGLAREHLRRASRRGRELGAPLTEAEALRALAGVHADGGAYEDALECYGRALALFRSLEAGHELADTVILQIVEVLSRRIEALDPHLFGHSARVAQYAVATAARMAFDEDRLKGLMVAGYLHDIGKLQLEPEMLGKTGPLTPAERERMQRHSAVGADHVARFGLPWDIAPMLRAHHEEHDGSGYPDRLAGEAIPLEARILHVVDVYDALVSDRPWRAAWTHEEAIGHLEVCAGRQYDPRVVNAFLAALRRPQKRGTEATAVPESIRFLEAMDALPKLRLVAA